MALRPGAPDALHVGWLEPASKQRRAGWDGTPSSTTWRLSPTTSSTGRWTSCSPARSGCRSRCSSRSPTCSTSRSEGVRLAVCQGNRSPKGRSLGSVRRSRARRWSSRCGAPASGAHEREPLRRPGAHLLATQETLDRAHQPHQRLPIQAVLATEVVDQPRPALVALVLPVAACCSRSHATTSFPVLTR
jgi:hypothetical protein